MREATTLRSRAPWGSPEPSAWAAAATCASAPNGSIAGSRPRQRTRRMSPRSYRRDHLEKRCSHPKRKWGRCACPWWFHCAALKTRYRFSLDKYLGRHVDRWEGSRSRQSYLAGDSCRPFPWPAGPSTSAGPRADVLSRVCRSLAGAGRAISWSPARSTNTVSAPSASSVSARHPPPVTIGETALDALTLPDFEAFADARRAAGKSAVAVNHDLKLLRSMCSGRSPRGCSSARRSASAMWRRSSWRRKSRGPDGLRRATTKNGCWPQQIPTCTRLRWP